MPALTIYLRQEIYEKLMNLPSGERSTLINKLLREHFSKEEENESND